MQDAIVISGWTWESCNVPERIALALARMGSRVLYCENPASFLRTVRRFGEVDKGIFALGLHFVGHRLNSLPFLPAVQTRLLVAQILSKAFELRLRDPVLIYPHGNHCLLVARELKKRGFPLVHVCMDYELELVSEHVRESHITLVIPRAAFEELRATFGEKVRLIPQLPAAKRSIAESGRVAEASDISCIPRPRLGYLGNLTDRISLGLLREVLSQKQEWQFISFASKKWLPLPNEHVLPWRSREELRSVLAALDVGFMPYDCTSPKNLHCVPLKLLDYFEYGIPVVSTPIRFVHQYEQLVYTGATADELVRAVSEALAEPQDSPKRAQRISVAREHSLERSAQVLASLLAELGGTDTAQGPSG